MATLTTVLSLRKPDGTDFVNRANDIASNLDLLDALFNTTTGHKHTGAGTNAPIVVIDDSQVVYDPTEAATLDTLSGSSHLRNNLNRIRFWLTQISGQALGTVTTSLNTHATSFHATGFGSVVGIGTANADGSGTTDTHANHIHTHGALATIANAHAAADITNAASLIAVNTFTKQYAASAVSVTTSATPTFDWNNGNVQYFTFPAGNVTTATFNNPIEGGRYMLVLTQDSVGSRTFAWPAAFHFPSGTTPTLSAGSKIDILGFVYRGGVYYATSALNYA